MHGTLMTRNVHVVSFLPRIKMKLKREVIFLFNNWREHKQQDRLDKRHNFRILMNCLKPCKDHLISSDNLISSSFPNSPCNFYQIYHTVCLLHFSNISCKLHSKHGIVYRGGFCPHCCAYPILSFNKKQSLRDAKKKKKRKILLIK